MSTTSIFFWRFRAGDLVSVIDITDQDTDAAWTSVPTDLLTRERA
jgi:hypothetical protein